MDMFIDKLAQRFVPQDLGKASAGTDTEELKKMRNRLTEINESLDRVEALLKANGEQLQNAGIDTTKISEQVATKVDAGVHKECVKVYRNVQAVVVDEVDKLITAQDEMYEISRKTLKRAGATLGLAIAAFSLSVISTIGVALLLMYTWNIKLF